PLQGKTALMEAATKGHYNAVLWLLREFGADINAEDFESHTPLHYACLVGRPLIVSLLLREGAPVEARDHGGRTPLFAASVTGHPITLRLLHRFGANAAATDSEDKVRGKKVGAQVNKESHIFWERPNSRSPFFPRTFSSAARCFPVDSSSLLLSRYVAPSVGQKVKPVSPAQEAQALEEERRRVQEAYRSMKRRHRDAVTTGPSSKVSFSALGLNFRPLMDSFSHHSSYPFGGPGMAGTHEAPPAHHSPMTPPATYLPGFLLGAGEGHPQPSPFHFASSARGQVLSPDLPNSGTTTGRSSLSRQPSNATFSSPASQRPSRVSFATPPVAGSSSTPLHRSASLKAASSYPRSPLATPQGPGRTPMPTSPDVLAFGATPAAEDSRDPGHNWLTVFGFPPDAVKQVLQKLAAFGVIVDRREPPSADCNWMHVRFQTRLQAKRALARHATVMFDRMMVGVVVCTDPKVTMGEEEDSFAQEKENLEPSTTTPRKGVMDSPARRVVPMDSSFMSPAVQEREPAGSGILTAIEKLFRF
ncbi:unnamed protein product, partial [Cyprideis torosa]